MIISLITRIKIEIAFPTLVSSDKSLSFYIILAFVSNVSILFSLRHINKSGYTGIYIISILRLMFS
jgi:hypothetical protein